MKKRRNIAAAFLLSSVMAVSAVSGAMTVSAEDYSVSITNVTNDQATHEYFAYQIFSGTVADIGGTKQLTEIEWGNGVDSDALLNALKASDKFGTDNPFADCTTAAQVAVELEKFAANGAEANAFADIVSQNLATTKYNISDNEKVPGGGYYFIKDTIKSAPSTNTHYAYSDHILRVVTDQDLTAITAKATVPSIDKKIGTSYASGTKTSTASIGDSVPFVLESFVPDMAKYNDYYYIINDTLSEGLTFNNDVAITVGEYQLTKETDFTVATSGNTFKIVFKNFYEQLYLNNTPNNTGDDGTHLGEKITVTYSATLNEKANIGTVGNPNTVDLTFSNNPNHTYGGSDRPTPDEENPGPGEDTVIGVTPQATTKTFTTGLKLVKLDATTKEILQGAKFQITGTGVKAVVINGQIFKEDASGTYYMLKDGTFTETAATTETEADYDSTTTKYKLISTVTKDTATSTSPVNQIGYSDANGIISFVGLDQGTYNISEIDAPEGYNKLPGNITIVVEAVLDDTAQTCAWTVKKDSTPISAEDNLFKFEVENNKGLTLPSTGGIGTTIFYIIGGSLILGAVILLITKKRMSVSDKK
jgi:fimbrial isopeptide formation D2 family protein/LPXTG-motif cell wall-anchored protein